MSYSFAAKLMAGACLGALLFVTTTSAAAQDVDEVISLLSEKVELTDDQRAELSGIDISNLAENGALWYVSARVQKILTDEQKMELLRGERSGSPAVRRGADARPRSQRHVRRGWRGQELLSSEQRQELREERSDLMEEHRELREQMRDEDADREEIRERMRELHAEMEEAAENILTDEQLEQMRERQEERPERRERAHRPISRTAAAGASIDRGEREVVAIYRLLTQASSQNTVQN